MNAQLATLNPRTTALDSNDDAVLMNALRDSLYPGSKPESVAMVLNYCRAAGLDPLTKPVHLVPMSVKKPGGGRDEYEWRDVVMPGIELYRIKADRTGRYAGQDDAEFGPEIHNDKWNLSFPQWCKVTVYKLTDAGRVAYSAKVFWLESYATAKRDTDMPNAMWKKRPYGQIEKCAEAAALRKAFPEVGAQPTADEMYGKPLDAEPLTERTVGVVPLAAPSATRAEAIKARLAARSSADPQPDPPVSLDAVLLRIAEAETEPDLRAASDLAKRLAHAEDKATARAAYKSRLAELTAPQEAPADPHLVATFAQLIAAVTSANLDDLETDLQAAALPDAARAQLLDDLASRRGALLAAA